MFDKFIFSKSQHNLDLVRFNQFTQKKRKNLKRRSISTITKIILFLIQARYKALGCFIISSLGCSYQLDGMKRCSFDMSVMQSNKTSFINLEIKLCVQVKRGGNDRRESEMFITLNEKTNKYENLLLVFWLILRFSLCFGFRIVTWVMLMFIERCVTVTMCESFLCASCLFTFRSVQCHAAARVGGETIKQKHKYDMDCVIRPDFFVRNLLGLSKGIAKRKKFVTNQFYQLDLAFMVLLVFAGKQACIMKCLPLWL